MKPSSCGCLCKDTDTRSAMTNPQTHCFVCSINIDTTNIQSEFLFVICPVTYSTVTCAVKIESRAETNSPISEQHQHLNFFIMWRQGGVICINVCWHDHLKVCFLFNSSGLDCDRRRVDSNVETEQFKL